MSITRKKSFESLPFTPKMFWSLTLNLRTWAQCWQMKDAIEARQGEAGRSVWVRNNNNNDNNSKILHNRANDRQHLIRPPCTQHFNDNQLHRQINHTVSNKRKERKINNDIEHKREISGWTHERMFWRKNRGVKARRMDTKGWGGVTLLSGTCLYSSEEQCYTTRIL